MIEKTDISEIVDGDDEITLIELSQSQYDAYKGEAEALGVNTHEYIELALKHEQMALSEKSEAMVKEDNKESDNLDVEVSTTAINNHIKRFLS